MLCGTVSGVVSSAASFVAALMPAGIGISTTPFVSYAPVQASWLMARMLPCAYMCRTPGRSRRVVLRPVCGAFRDLCGISMMPYISCSGWAFHFQFIFRFLCRCGCYIKGNCQSCEHNPIKHPFHITMFLGILSNSHAAEGRKYVKPLNVQRWQERA